MSINNCCCAQTTTPPPGVTAEPSCASSETIMSQTGLITDLNCGIKPVIGEILGVQMQSTAITVDSVPAPNLFATSAKDTFVFGYALERHISEVTSTEGDEERFVAIPYPQLLSPIEGTIPCYWVWWTKNRSLELDIKFPNNNFSGCIEQDVEYYKGDGGYWCDAYGNNNGLQGSYSHDGNSCWRGAQWAPSDLTNLYVENFDQSSSKTDYTYVDGDFGQSANSIGDKSGAPGIVGFGCCTGWGHDKCSPSDFQLFGVNEVGSYHNEGNGGQQYYSSYAINKYSHHNVKYPASTVQERLASIKTGGGSCYAHVDHPTKLHKCWRNDTSNPPRYDLQPGDGDNQIGENCKDVVVNGLTPYQRRVSQERSPDIWEIHEFNDSFPIKIKVQDLSIDRPAVVKIWGEKSITMSGALKNQEDGLVKYTDLSCGGNNISLVRQNAEPRVYPVYQSSPDQSMISPTKSRKTIIITNEGSVIPTGILQGAEMLYKVGSTWYIGGGGSSQIQYPSENFIKKVSTGYNHVICTRDNYTAEVSETTVNGPGSRQYYSSSIPTAIQINSGFDYNQIDIPYSPGSKRFKYDWVTHDCTGNGCTSCMNPLFDIKDLTVGPANLLNNNCDSGLVPVVGDSIKVASGSCRFTKTNPNDVQIDCRNYTPWCAPCFTAPGETCPLCPANICYPGNPPSFGTLSCQGSNNNWITPEKTSSCIANPTPFCDSGYPPLTCGTVNNWYICGTGGFNSTLHDYADYRAYTCGRDITNYDKNYCEGIQAWDSISAGGYHNVAINKHSTFTASGATLCTCPLPETNVYPFGDAYNPGNNVVAWGAGEQSSGIWPNFGQSIVPDIGQCKKVSAGGYHSLAIDNNNKIRAWGAGYDGAPTNCPVPYDSQFVHFGQSNIPVAIKDIEFIEISAGQFHSCGIRKDNGKVICWGAGTVVEPNGGVCQANWGQSIVDPNLGKCTSISAGGFHTCAITELGTVKCWGKNVNGQCDAPSDACVQISCGLNFSAGRFVEDLYETFPYWNASNQRSTPAIDPSSPVGGFWPISLFRYFFAFASMEFTYGRGVSPETPGICDVDWGRSLPKAYHQRSDAVHIFAFETEIYNGNDSKLAEQLMEEELGLYIYQGEPIQSSWGHMGDGYSAVEPGWKSNSDNVNRNLSSPYYWADRMSCKDWRQEIWDDLQIIKGAAGLVDWPDLNDLRTKYPSPGNIKPVGAYRIRGDKFDIRDARGNELNTSKRPPELAKMACTSIDPNLTFTNLNCVGRVAIPPEYYDIIDNKYTLQVNKDIYKLVKPESIFLNREQLDAYNRLTLSVYFRPKPIGWDYSGPDWLFSDWPTPEISEITGGARSWRYGWLQSDRRKTRPRTVTDKSSSLVSTGIGTNNIVGKSVQGQPFWDTYNRGPVATKISSTLQLTVSCDYIGPQVAYTHNAHIYAARHIPGINTKGGVIKQDNQGIAYPMQYEPKYYTCQLFNIT